MSGNAAVTAVISDIEENGLRFAERGHSAWCAPYDALRTPSADSKRACYQVDWNCKGIPLPIRTLREARHNTSPTSLKALEGGRGLRARRTSRTRPLRPLRGHALGACEGARDPCTERDVVLGATAQIDFRSRPSSPANRPEHPGSGLDMKRSCVYGTVRHT